MKKLKICLVTAGDFLFTALLGVLATWKFFELSDILGPDEIDKDGGEYVSVYVHRFGTGTCLISITVIAGIISAILVLRLGKTEKMLKIRSINLIILVAITCFWTWYYKEYSFYHNCIYENWDWIEEVDNMPSSSDGETEEKLSLSNKEREEKMTELVAFCKEHREKLNEMSEYFLDAVEEVSDYKDEKNLPDIDELAAAFTDEESREILEKLKPYYPYEYDYNYEFKQVYFYYPYDYEGEYSDVEFKIVYIDTDGEELEVFMENMSTGWEVRKIDKHLFVVLESWPYA